MGQSLIVKRYFKKFCQPFAKKELSEEIFEGLADIMDFPISGSTKRYPAYFCMGGGNQESEPYCVISGRYRDRDGGEAVAIAIGLWDEERNCFSVLKKTKDGKSLPIPFRVKADKAVIEVRSIIRILSGAQNLEEVLELYNKEARANQ